VYEKSSNSRRSGRNTTGPRHDSDFENEGSEHESEVEVEDEDELEQSEQESDEPTDEGHDSGLKLKGKQTNRKISGTIKRTASVAQGTSETGRPTGKTTANEMCKLLGRDAGEPKGLNTSLPPLSSIDDIFKDITNKALRLGLREILEKMRK